MAPRALVLAYQARNKRHTRIDPRRWQAMQRCWGNCSRRPPDPPAVSVGRGGLRQIGPIAGSLAR